jgi:hypothetical protein
MRRIHLSRKFMTPALAGLVLGIGYLDSRTGFLLSLFPLYLIPVVIVAWCDTRGVTAIITLLAAVIIMMKDTFAPESIRGLFYYWDVTIKILLLFIISYGVSQIKKLLVEKEKKNRELEQALSEIKELRQMVPICAWCHSVRNDRGFYERVEVYISKLTGADLTHGICPDCMKKYYGHLTRNGEEKQPGGHQKIE